MRIKLDGTDRKILELLQTNSNITNAQLAQEIGLSPAPTLERVKKLENSEVIKVIMQSLTLRPWGWESALSSPFHSKDTTKTTLNDSSGR